MTETIAALSSGLVPSGVAVIRVSGPRARSCLDALTGSVPPPRHAALRTLHCPRTGDRLDQALVLFFPGPASFTGEDVAEFHCHGGVAVVEGVLAALLSLPGISAAEAGGFTRQAFLNGNIDLTQVEGLGDLIHATTEAQRGLALAQYQGAASERLAGWRDDIAVCRALIEADLDFSDEDDVPGSVIDALPERLGGLIAALDGELADGAGERLREGFRVVLAGAPNVGKSTLLNALLDREAALVSAVPGTTRDRIDAFVEWDGLPILLSDTAGLRDETGDPIEKLGIARSLQALSEANCVIWLHDGGLVGEALPDGRDKRTIRVRSKSDQLGSGASTGGGDWDVAISARTGAGLAALRDFTVQQLRERYGLDGGAVRSAVAINPRRRQALLETRDHLQEALDCLNGGCGPELAAEALRRGQRVLGTITGDVDVEGVLDVLFSRFCIGK